MIRRAAPRSAPVTGGRRRIGLVGALFVLASCAGGDDATETADAPDGGDAETRATAVDDPVDTAGRGDPPDQGASGAGSSTSTAERSDDDSTAGSDDQRPADGNTEACWSAPSAEGTDEITFVDATDDYGLLEPLTGMYGHAIASGDVNADGWTDLFVGTFADRPDEDYQVRGADGPSPDRLLLGGPDGFAVDGSFPGQHARSSGATFADLDGDGDLDLVVARNPRGESEIGSRPTTIFERDDDGWEVAATLAADVGGRSVAAVDVDRDGLADLAIAGDRFGAGPTRFYRNLGGMEFEDVTETWGIPLDVETLALSTVDLDGDGWIDIVFSGDTRVLMGRGPGEFEIVEQPVLAWELHGEEDDPAGVAVGDLDHDGRPDLVIGQHFNSTLDFGEQVPVRIFLNRSEPGDLRLIDVTEESGSPPLPTKSPHVAVADLDNDGWPDIVTSAVANDGGPMVLRNMGLADDDVPEFEPSAEVSQEYRVTGTLIDLDRDGRLDPMTVAWEPGQASTAHRSTGPSGAWTEVDVAALGSGAVGSSVSASSPSLSEAETYRTWIASTDGYAAGRSATARFGLGDAPGDIDITVTPLEGDPVAISGTTNQAIAIGDCP